MSVLFAGGRGPSGPVLKRETLEQMWRPQFAEAGAKTGYGIGFRVGDLEGHRTIGHGGAIYGFATELAGLPDDKLGVVVVTDMDCANAVATHIAEEALKLMLAARENKSLPRLVYPAPLTAGLAHKLEGTYSGERGGVALTDWDGRLFMVNSEGSERVELKMSGDVLTRDDRLAYGGKIAPRNDGIEIDGQFYKKTEVSKPEAIPSRWKGLIGEYGWDHDVLYVLEKNGRINVLIEWFEYAPLEEVSETVFQFPARGLYDGEQLVFTRDSSGRATEVRVGPVVFKRRAVGTEEGVTFKINPVKKIDELRREALAATPPKEAGEFRKPDLVDLTTLDPTIKLDIRYASTNNFMGEVFYSQARAFLQRPAAEALKRAADKLKPLGYGLLIHDAYRPWYVTKMFWEATPPDKKIFVADPREGSRHNRGCAVDMSLYHLATGKPVEMVGGYDEMSERSFPNYPGGTSVQRWYREELRHAMESVGFNVYEFEWWHFDYKDWAKYPVLNLVFERLGR